MFRRLLLLLALIVALPATARPACHDAGGVQPVSVSAHRMAVHGSGGHDHRSADAGGHDCLGCIPPGMLLGARVGGAPLPRTRTMPAPIAALAPGEALRPTPPPPKNA